MSAISSFNIGLQRCDIQPLNTLRIFWNTPVISDLDFFFSTGVQGSYNILQSEWALSEDSFEM